MNMFEFLHRTPAGLLRFAAAARLADHLRGGGLAVLPTETGYLLGAVATDLTAVRKVFRAKGRSPANPVHVACSSLALAAGFAELDDLATDLLARFTPGPLTVVVPARSTLPAGLVTMNGTVGIRVPDHPATLQVVALLGAPITATSLNRSGEESLPLDRGQLETLDWPAGEPVYVVEHDEAITEPRASTLVRVTGGDIELLRAGPVDVAALRQG
jgi:L-threonylcarbamoyladenylate synthase